MRALTPRQVAAIQAYTGTAYRAINGFLRAGGHAERAIKDYIADIDEALSDNPAPAEIVVYRGVSEAYADELVAAGLAVGDILRDKGFLSASRRRTIAEDFMSGSAGMLFAIRIYPGAQALDISAISNYPAEAETLLARDMPLRVVDYDPADDILILEIAEDE